MNQSRRSDQRRPAPESPDRLPPHSLEAEQGILGCVFLAPAEVVPQCRQVFGISEPFYDLRHALLYRTLLHMHEAGEAIDVITVQQRLKDHGNLADVGGIAYLAQLPDVVPSAANAGYYLQIVREKFLLRSAIRSASTLVSRAMELEGGAEPLIQGAAEQFTALATALQTQSGEQARPPHLKTADEYNDKVWNCFFGSDAGEPGIELPFGFPMKIRGGELTFLIGESGAGKSTITGYLGLHLVHKEGRLFVASMEVRPEITLKMLVQQLVGLRDLQDLPAHHKLVRDAIAWLQERVVIYDFLGIANWRELMEAMGYAAQFLGCTHFLVDSVMRLGVADDDYAEQGACAKAFANFCVGRNVHTFLVNHLNKGDGTAKQRSRGSAQWTDNAHNILHIKANREKAEQLAELWEEKKALERTNSFKDSLRAKWQTSMDALRPKWDANLVLHKQRWPGSRQNASTYLWFDNRSLQLRDAVEKPHAVNWLDLWKPRQRHHHEPKPISGHPAGQQGQP